MSGRPLADSGVRGRSSPVVEKSTRGALQEELGHQVIQRFPQEKRRNTFELEEQKGKWRRRETSQEEDFDNLEMMLMEEEEAKRTRAVDEKQMMDDVALLMRKVADALAEFAMDQSIENLMSMGLDQ